MRGQSENRPTLDDRTMKQSVRGRHRHQRRDFPAATRLTEDRDEVWIATESTDVVAHPLQRSNDVEKTYGCGLREFRAHRIAEIRVAEHVQAMIQRHDDNVVRAREAGAVENAARA